ncbi:MAG: acetate/propionate family kinase [Acidimicrobiales bacterium]|nr:acetate/propionate family kinase [Acidimicrobiales bacterium]
MDDQVLIVNPGSSSLKLRVVGTGDRILATTDGPAPGDDVDDVLSSFLEEAPPVRAVGVRVVHGGARFRSPVVVDEEVARALADLDELAPLHNPPARALISAVRRVLPDTPVVACFDTSFHHTLPEAAAVWAVPWEWTSGLGIRRYGFHGLSHQWATRRGAEMLDRPVEELRIVVCHLGAGASLAAVDGGRSVDTTMGFTPLDGLVMATRSGAVDPGALLWVQRHAGLSPDDMEHALDHESGLLALSGRSGDLREVLDGVEAGDERCSLALDVYLHRLRAAMAAMVASLGGVDAFVFTGGVGEHSPVVRARALEGLAFLGAGVDPQANAEAVGRDGIIGATGSSVDALVVVAREELSMAAGVRAAVDEGR